MMEVREDGESEVEGALLSVALGHRNVFQRTHCPLPEYFHGVVVSHSFSDAFASLCRDAVECETAE